MISEWEETDFHYQLWAHSSTYFQFLLHATNHSSKMCASIKLQLVCIEKRNEPKKTEEFLLCCKASKSNKKICVMSNGECASPKLDRIRIARNTTAIVTTPDLFVIETLQNFLRFSSSLLLRLLLLLWLPIVKWLQLEKHKKKSTYKSINRRI